MTDFDIRDRETLPYTLEPVRRVGGACVHRHQLVEDPNGYHYLVLGFTEDGVEMIQPDFDGPAFTVEEFEEYEPLTGVDGTPVWGY